MGLWKPLTPRHGLFCWWSHQKHLSKTRCFATWQICTPYCFLKALLAIALHDVPAVAPNRLAANLHGNPESSQGFFGGRNGSGSWSLSQVFNFVQLRKVIKSGGFLFGVFWKCLEKWTVTVDKMFGQWCHQISPRHSHWKLVIWTPRIPPPPKPVQKSHDPPRARRDQPGSDLAGWILVGENVQHTNNSDWSNTISDLGRTRLDPTVKIYTRGKCKVFFFCPVVLGFL